MLRDKFAMKTKLDLAHDWAMKHGNAETIGSRQNMVKHAWDYANEMYKQLEERESKGMSEAARNKPKIISTPNWQPDWSQAPSSMITHWSKEGNETCTWWVGEPSIDKETHFENPENPHSRYHSDAPSFDYKGDWKDSLRKRPEGK